MEFCVLGPLVVAGRDGPAGAKERALLACLLLEPARAVMTETLLEVVWPGTPRAVAARSLSVRLANLRSFLEPDRARGARSTVLVHGAGGYRLAVEPERVDAQRFAALVRRAASEPPGSALAAYEQALALWRGPPFPEIADTEPAMAEIQRLGELRAQAAAGRARALVELGRPEAAVADLRRLVADEPWREEPVRALAVALYRAGRQVEALEALRALAGELGELGLRASPETRELERQILVHDAALAPPAAPSARLAPVARLPARASRFLGREAELARAAELLAAGPLVTVTGVGGAGKTRLALELGARLRDRFADGAWWCELAPLERAEDVPGAVADALGVELTGGGGVERIVQRLAPLRALLLLDNCEHVLECAAAVAERLLAGCPGLRIVATSRAPLGVEGERLVRLQGLAPATAAAMFHDRAQAAGGLADDGSGRAAVDELCQRLDGLPLAIELAAGRTRSLTAAEIAARLDERFGLLAVPGRRAAARHSTLQAAIDWSYELLEEPQRRVFERLSVFHRPCALAAARDVCAGDGVHAETVEGLLDQLVAHSLVTPTRTGDRTAYGLLETLRAYAADRLARRGETAPARDRHADHLVARVERLREDQAGWRAPGLPFAAEFEDVRAAVRWCLERRAAPERAYLLVGALWAMTIARHAEEIALLAEETLQRQPADDPARLHALGTAATARIFMGDLAAAARHAEQALALERRAGAPALIARRALSGIAYLRGDVHEALRLMQDLARRARAAGDEPLACETDGFIVLALHAAGDARAAAALAGEMRARADGLRSPILVSWSRYASGIIALAGEPATARRWLTDSLALARKIGYHHMVSLNLRGLGVAALLEGEHDEAAERLLEALAYDEARAKPSTQWGTLMAFAPLLAARGADEPAAALLAATERLPAAPLLASLALVGTLGARTREQLAARMPPQRLASATAHGHTLDLAAATALAQAELTALTDRPAQPPPPPSR